MTSEGKWRLITATMRKHYPVLADVWEAAPGRFGGGWVDEFLGGVEGLFDEVGEANGEFLLQLMDSYAEFAADSMRSQAYFEKFGRYPATNYEEVRRTCYDNPEHMNKSYLPGMYISHYLWPQHYNMLRAFRYGVLPRVGSSRLFFEVGVGCGMYSRTTLEGLPQTRGVGFDISRYSLEFTSNVLARFGLSGRYECQQRDISLGYDRQCDFLICQEVLEHLEDPAQFVSWLAAMVKPGGYAYITAALNAAHSDHIYLFRTPDELEEMVRRAGFRLISSQEEFAPGSKDRSKTPSLCAFLCQIPL